jgi:hypothetical protein
LHNVEIRIRENFGPTPTPMPVFLEAAARQWRTFAMSPAIAIVGMVDIAWKAAQ